MNQKYKQNFIRAGALAKEVRSFGKSLIVKGASYLDVVAKIQQKIFDLGARPAFPPQIALNHVAAHFLPQPGEEIQLTDQIVKLDIGVCVDGAIGDCAVTVDLSGQFQSLVDAAEAALLNAEQSIKVGQPIREIGKIIEDTITSFGYSPVRNLSGHGLGEYKIHMPPIIPNYHDQSKAIIRPGMTFAIEPFVTHDQSKAIIRPGMTFAIEPFVTNGKGLIYEGGTATIFGLDGSKPIRSELARSLLTKIRTFSGLPFAIYDLVDPEWPFKKVNEALDELLKLGVVVGYAPLIEQAQGMVAQAENSVLVDEKGQVFITTR